jgi:DNA replication protein DnaC
MSEPTVVGQHVDGFMAVLERCREKHGLDMQAAEAADAKRREEYRVWAASSEGQAELAARAQGAALAREVEKFKLWTAAAQQIGVPRRFVAATLQNVDPADFEPGTHITPIQATVDRVRRYVVEEHPHGRALALCGLQGLGKSYAVAATLRVLFEHEDYRGQMFWNATTLRTALMNLEKRGAIIDGLLTAPMLVLDDLGLEYSREGDYWEGVLDTIFVEREGNMLPLLVTTNLSPEKLEQKLGPRAWDRLMGSWGAVFEVVGKSVRGKEAI